MQRRVRRYGFVSRDKQMHLFMVWDEFWYMGGVVDATEVFSICAHWVWRVLKAHERYLVWANSHHTHPWIVGKK